MNRSNYFVSNTPADSDLVRLFKEELDRLTLLYYKAINSNDLTKANVLLKKIKKVADTLQEDYDAWAGIRIPQEYLKGAKYVDDSLTKEASYIAIAKAGKKELTKMVEELGPIHVDAVNALLNNSKNYVKSSLDGMERQAITMVNELQQEKIREQLAKWIISGDSMYNMKKRVSEYLEANKITGFKDRGGKLWTMDRYVDMLTRTETSIANVQGTINRSVQIWITRFKIIEQADCCSVCSEYREEIVDISEKWIADFPPFHPNCRGYIIPVFDEKEILQAKLDNL